MNLTINVSDISIYPNTHGLNCSILINGVDNGGTDTSSVTVDDNSIVSVLISKSGYYPYVKDIVVFDEDLLFTVFLVPIITDAGDPSYRKPYPSFFSYIKPCSHSVYILNTSSEPYTHFEYLVDNQSFSTIQDTIFNAGEAGTFNIKQVSTVYNLVEVEGTLLEAGLLWNLNTSSSVNIVEYRPEFSLQINTNASPVGSTAEVVVGIEATIVPDIAINNSKGDTLCSLGQLVYTLYDIEGIQVGDPLEYDLDLTAFPEPETIAFTFIPEQAGDYKLVTTVSNCCYTTTIETIIQSANSISVVSDEHIHTAYNLSLVKPLTITLFDRGGTEVIQEPVTIDPNTSHDVIVTEDNIYVLKTSYEETGEDYYFIIADYTDLKKCLADVIKAVICKDDDPCCDRCNDKDKDILNKLIAINTTYFSYLQGIYGFNNIYEALSDTMIQELYEADYVFKMAKKYCNCGTKMKGGCSTC